MIASGFDFIFLTGDHAEMLLARLWVIAEENRRGAKRCLLVRLPGAVRFCWVQS